MQNLLYFLILFIFLNSCIAKKEISTPIIDCIPSDSCTFSFKITETNDDIVKAIPFFYISLLPRQGICCDTNFNGECEFKTKRPLSEDSIAFMCGFLNEKDTFSIKLNDCENNYFSSYDLPRWFKDSINTMPKPKVIHFRSSPQMQTK